MSSLLLHKNFKVVDCPLKSPSVDRKMSAIANRVIEFSSLGRSRDSLKLNGSN
ncbi:MAG: hypothetical protein V7L20_27770 [Nostoc sp.]|uniref:hypothetical protein n=1 Tax=Nostoc sp. TaxID=1180 RepID=UPI002FF7B34C